MEYSSCPPACRYVVFIRVHCSCSPGQDKQDASRQGPPGGCTPTTPVAALVGYIDSGKFINVSANRQRNRYCCRCFWFLVPGSWLLLLLLRHADGVLFRPKSNNASLFLHAKICARLLNGFPLRHFKGMGKGMVIGRVSYRRQEQGQ